MPNNFFTRVLLIIVLTLPMAMPSSAAADAHLQPRRRYRLIFGRGGDSVGLDPALEEDGESFKVCDNIYDTLVEYKDGSTELEPGLATRWGKFRRWFDVDFSLTARCDFP